ncbi:MAG: tripartite tricarboxylate transporter TctB family protein [Clostridia bacterium]|nr:tripartite tricarboxylate transporter TctB family protein [Clostridia bacterium]
MKKKKPFSELVIGLACMALGVAVFIAAGNLQQVRLGIGPSGFPKFIAIVLGILGLAQTVTALSCGVEAPKFDVDKRAASLFIAAVAMAIAYVMLVTQIGFIILTPLLLIGLMYLFGERSIVKMLIIAVITTVCVWLLFTEVFMIFLPTGRIFA